MATGVLAVNDGQVYRTYRLEQLVTLPLVVPDVQRLIDDDHVQAIRAYQLARLHEHGSFLFLGPLTVGDLGSSLFLLDGQHRYHAMRLLYMHQPAYLVTVLHVRITPQFSLRDAFLLLNQSTPVPQYVMDAAVDLSHRSILDAFIQAFSHEYKPYLSKAQRPQRPNVNVQQLADSLAQSGVVGRCADAHELLHFVKYLNVHVWPALEPKHVAKCADKVGPGGTVLYISCDRDWKWAEYMDRYDAFRRSMAAPCVVAPSTTTMAGGVVTVAPPPRKAIPKSVRTQLWELYFDTLKGKCIVCQAVLHLKNMECGHVVAAAHGGGDHLMNLVPICGGCNRSMADTNMDIFVRTYYRAELHKGTDGRVEMRPLPA